MKQDMFSTKEDNSSNEIFKNIEPEKRNTYFN